MRPVEFAPVGTLRVAAWPIEALAPFGRRELLDDAAALRGSDGIARFERLYLETMARERLALWNQTAGDPRFMRALALANPALMRRVQERAPAAFDEAAPNKRTRHLETTLYRLLARAVGRTEPFGAWCGVGVLELGAATRFESVARRRCVAPDLTFYAEVLRRCSHVPGTARHARYRVNPTLGRAAGGDYGFWAPPGTPHPGYHTLGCSPELDGALERLRELGSFTILEAESSLGVAPHVLDGFFFEQLIPQGLIVGGLQLPCFFSDPWDALEQMEADLPLPNRPAWTRLRTELREICLDVEQIYEEASCDQLAGLGDRAATCAARFGASLELQQLPALSLHMDSSAPFRLTLGPDSISSLSSAVARDEADKSGAVRAYNESLRRVQCERLGVRGVSIRGLSESCLADPLQAHDWPHLAIEDYQPEWPLRAIFAHMVTGPANGLRLTGHSLVDDVASPVSRFLPLLSRTGRIATESLVAWLRLAHSSVSSPSLAAFGACHVAAPNAAAQADLGLPRFSLWGVGPGIHSLAAARIVGLVERGLVSVVVDEQPLGMLSLSAVNLGVDDPLAQLLLMSSFRFPRPAQLPTAFCESASHPAVEHPRLPAHTLEDLSKRQGINRFLKWASCVGDRRGQVNVHRRGVPPLRVSVDSPLAVAALLEGVQADWGDLDLRPVGPVPFLQDAGGHYVSQLVLPFRSLTTT